MLLKGGFQYANGLLCGIVNGIIEGLAGTLELLAMIFRATSALHKMTNDIFDTFVVLKEMLENVIEAFLEYQLGKFIMMLANAPFKIISAIAGLDIKKTFQSAGALISGITPAKIGYFIGYAGGMVIEMALEALFTAGIATAAKVVLKYSKKLGEGATAVVNQGGSAIKKVSQANADTLIKQITDLFESLRSGKAIDTLQKWIDDVILEIKKALGLVDEVAWMSSFFLRFGDDWKTIYNASKLAKRADDGWFNVLCHGSTKQVQVNGRVYKPDAFASYLKENGYENGKKVRLVSCNTGAKPDGFAQKLANILKVEVEAPTDVIKVNDIGEFIVGERHAGVMKVFKPQI
jgi:hypothetical protein